MGGRKRNAQGPPSARRERPNLKNRRRGTKIADTQEIEAPKSGHSESDGDREHGSLDSSTLHRPKEATRNSQVHNCDAELDISVNPRPTPGIHDAVRITDNEGLQAHATEAIETVSVDADTEQDSEDPFMSPESRFQTECDLRNLHRLELEAQNRNQLENVERIRKIAQDTQIPDSMHVDLPNSQDTPTTGYGQYVANFGTPQLSKEPSQIHANETPPSGYEQGMYGEAAEDPHLEAPRGGKFMYMLGRANLGLLDPAFSCPSIPIEGEIQSAQPVVVEACNSPPRTPLPLPTIFEEWRSCRIPIAPTRENATSSKSPVAQENHLTSVPSAMAFTPRSAAAPNRSPISSLASNVQCTAAPTLSEPLTPSLCRHTAATQPSKETSTATNPSRLASATSLARDNRGRASPMPIFVGGLTTQNLAVPIAHQSTEPTRPNSAAARMELNSATTTIGQNSAAVPTGQNSAATTTRQNSTPVPTGQISATTPIAQNSGAAQTAQNSTVGQARKKSAATPTRRNSSKAPRRGRATTLSSIGTSSSLPCTRNESTTTAPLNTTTTQQQGNATVRQFRGTQSGMPSPGNPPVATQGLETTTHPRRGTTTTVPCIGTRPSTPSTCDPLEIVPEVIATAPSGRRNANLAQPRASLEPLLPHQQAGGIPSSVSEAPAPDIGGSNVPSAGNNVTKRPLRQELPLEVFSRVCEVDKLRKRKERAKNKGIALPNTTGGVVSVVKCPSLELADGEPVGASYGEASTALALILPTEIPAFRLFQSVTLDEVQRIHNRLAAQYANGETLLPTWTRGSLLRTMKPRRTRIRRKVKKHLAKVARCRRGQQPIPLPEGVFQIELEHFQKELADREFLKLSKLMTDKSLGMLRKNGCGNYCGAGGYHRAKAIIRKREGRPVTVTDLRQWKVEKQAAYENGPSRTATARRANGAPPLPSINVETTSSSGTENSMSCLKSDDDEDVEEQVHGSGESDEDDSTESGDGSGSDGSEEDGVSGANGAECSAAPIAAELEEMDGDWLHPIKGPLAFCRRWRFLWKMEPTDHDVVAWDENGRPPLYRKP